MAFTIRLQRILAYYGLIIGVLCLILGVLALGFTWYTYTNPPTEQVTNEINQQQIQTTSQTRAVVTGENTTLYEQGVILEEQSVYLFSATPNLTIQTTTRVPDNLLVSVKQRLTFDMQASREGQIFWSDRRLLAHSNEEIRDGSTTLTATVNMSAIQQTISQKRNEIGDIGTFKTEFNLTVMYNTNKYTGQLSTTASLVLVEQAYWLGNSLSTSRAHSETITRQTVGQPNMLLVYSTGGSGAVLFLAGIIISVLYFRTPPIEEIETLIARSRYDEWISNGEIPTKSEKEYVRIDTLEDLVDVAIDQNKRVIYDESYDTYAVMEGGGLVYYFATGDRSFDDWLEV